MCDVALVMALDILRLVDRALFRLLTESDFLARAENGVWWQGIFLVVHMEPKASHFTERRTVSIGCEGWPPRNHDH